MCDFVMYVLIKSAISKFFYNFSATIPWWLKLDGDLLVIVIATTVIIILVIIVICVVIFLMCRRRHTKLKCKFLILTKKSN